MINIKDALAKLDAGDSASFVACEQTIDATLLKFDGTPALVDVGRHGPRRKVLEKLREAYRACGWAVEIVDGDQRDPGPYLRFCAPVTR